jgi:hypothetical protein
MPMCKDGGYTFRGRDRARVCGFLISMRKRVVIHANVMTVSNCFDLSGTYDGPSGLAFDTKSRILFVACRDSRTMTIVSVADGKVVTTIAIGVETDGATFDPNTMEAFAPARDGTLKVIEEKSATDFAVEQRFKP